MPASPVSESATFLVLRSADLLSKTGFWDGAEPDLVLDWLEERGRAEDLAWLEAVDGRDPGDGARWHAVLRRLVRAYLVPVLDQRVEVVDVEGVHNPVRAERVDGVDVTRCWTGDQRRPVLAPAEVRVPAVDVLAAVAEVRAATRTTST